MKLVNDNSNLVLSPKWRAIRLEEERHLRRLFEFLEVDCVFDVGANVGQYGRMLREYVGFKGQIISFEPNPRAFEHLQRASAGDPLWALEPIGLGRTAGTLKFHAYEMSELGSFRTLDTSSRHAPAQASVQELDVPVQTLADFLPNAIARLKFCRPFLKMDTQGYDLDVATGAGEALSSFVGLQSELSFRAIYEGASGYREAIDFFESRGFVLSRLVPNNDVHFPELVEMDAIFSRTVKASRGAC